MNQTQTTREVTISISNDYTFLGEEADSDDLDRFEANLAKLVRDEFGVKVRTVRGSNPRDYSTYCRDDADVNARLREIATTDEWTHLLG